MSGSRKNSMDSNGFYPILHREEGLKIIEALDNLTPWDRYELLRSYVLDRFTFEEQYDAFIDGTDYARTTNDECCDFVGAIIDGDLENDVLSAMDKQIIVNFIVNNGYTHKVLRQEDHDILADAINKMPEKKLGDTLKELAKICKKFKIEVKPAEEDKPDELPGGYYE